MKTHLAQLVSCLALMTMFAGRLHAEQLDVLEFLPNKSEISWNLDASLHTVHGTFDLKRGTVRFNPATGELSGEIVIDAKSGKSGNEGRDRKMHTTVLESERFPEIVFRPDRVDGKVAPQGTSTVQVHGKFAIHGTEHEMTVPVQVLMAPDGWTAETTFVVPYVDWGMKSPNTFLLRVSPHVELRVHASSSR
jgi:polyisoprenoid-binding protein YceI